MVTFCGHGELGDREEVWAWLQAVLTQLIEQGERQFYLGGYGAFDRLAAEALRLQKESYPDIEQVLVLAYLNSKRNLRGYDATIYPPLETVPPRFAISKRNQWMVEQADIVVAYVTHDWGGAAETLRHARRKKKEIFLFPAVLGERARKRP